MRKITTFTWHLSMGTVWCLDSSILDSESAVSTRARNLFLLLQIKFLGDAQLATYPYQYTPARWTWPAHTSSPPYLPCSTATLEEIIKLM